MKYGITLHTKQMNELTLLHMNASVAINHVLPQEAISNLSKHLSLAHPDFFRELIDQQASA